MTNTRAQDGLRDKIAESTGQKLLKVARLYNRRAIDELRQKGHPLREAHTRLFPHLELEGIRLTDLASRAGITKQSAQKLIDEMVGFGYLKRVADPADGRARLIIPTAKGIRGAGDGLAALGVVESELLAQLGPKKVAALSRTLDEMLGAFGQLGVQS